MALVLWDDDYSPCDQLIGVCLTGAPTCWLLEYVCSLLLFYTSISPADCSQPRLIFPPQIPGPILNRPAFALVRNPIIPQTMENKIACKDLPVSMDHPALVVGARGEGFSNSARPADGSPIELICSSAEQSLDALVQAWQLRHLSQDSLSMYEVDIIPAWLFTFGIMCNAHSITILALIPLLDSSNSSIRYICKTVDDIPFGAFGTPATEESDTVPSRLMERIQLLTAMTTITKHAFRLCDIFDAPFLWPPAGAPEVVISAPQGESGSRPTSPVANPEERLASYEPEPKHWAARCNSDDDDYGDMDVNMSEEEGEKAGDGDGGVTEAGKIDPDQQRRIELWVLEVGPFDL